MSFEEMDPRRYDWLSSFKFTPVERGGHLWASDGIVHMCICCGVVSGLHDEDGPCLGDQIAALTAERDRAVAALERISKDGRLPCCRTCICCQTLSHVATMALAEVKR